MMASKAGPKGSAQKKGQTYGSANKRRLISAQSSASEPSPYDFPDTESPGSPPQPKKAPPRPTSQPTLPKKPIASKTNGAASPSRGISSAPRSQSDDERKRPHAAAFGKDDVKKKTLPASTSSTPKSSPLRAMERAPETIKKPIPSKPRPVERRVERPVEKPIARPVEPSTEPSPRQRVIPLVSQSDSKPKAASQESQPTSAPRRKRLIDALSAQEPQASDSEESEDETSPHNAVRSLRQGSQTPLSQASGSATDMDMRAPTSSHVRTPASKKVKYTYSQARSIRSDTQQSTDDPFGLGPDPIDQSLLPSPPTKPSGDAFDLPDDDDLDLDGEPKMGIKSAHELRRAGANSRFTDEMEDLLSRIGTPGRTSSSMRRNALLELSQKLGRDDFAMQFRDHTARDNVAKGVGNEQDMVASFALGASLIMFLSSKAAPNLAQHLAEERIGSLLARMLRLSEDMDSIASQRATNLSKASRKTVSDVKSSLLKMPIWHGRQTTKLSPRTVALQLFNILHPYLDTRFREQLLSDVEKELDGIVEEQAAEGSEDGAEFALIVCVLGCESGVATPTGQSWILRHARHSARFLRIILKNSQRRDEVKSAALKVAINTTNTQSGAEAFCRRTILSGLTANINEGLGEVQAAVEQGAFENALYEELVLVLGLLINILEHWPPARAALDEGDLEILSTIFFDSHKTINEADSEDKTKVSVALGYLAVTLGYLSLEQRARTMISERTRGAGMRQLIDSIRQFIGIYRRVESNMNELEGLVNDLERCSR